MCKLNGKYCSNAFIGIDGMKKEKKQRPQQQHKNE